MREPKKVKGNDMKVMTQCPGKTKVMGSYLFPGSSTERSGETDRRERRMECWALIPCKVPQLLLHTDVLARDSFRAQLGLDSSTTSRCPGGRCGHLITDKQAYKDVQASVIGKLSCIFQSFA